MKHKRHRHNAHEKKGFDWKLVLVVLLAFAFVLYISNGPDLGPKSSTREVTKDTLKFTDQGNVYHKGDNRYLAGDADGNGKINHHDAILVAQLIYKDENGRDVKSPGNPDANGDGRVTDADIERILVRALKLGNLPELGPSTGIWGGSCDIFIRGDANADSTVNVFDAVHITQVLFLGTNYLGDCFDRADANDDETIDISDPVAILIAEYTSGPALPHPYPQPGFERVRSEYNPNVGEQIQFASLTGSPIFTSQEFPEALDDELFAGQFSYTQTLTTGEDLIYNFFRDRDYEDLAGLPERTPSLGLEVNSNSEVIIYRLEFDTAAASQVTPPDTGTPDFENEDLIILGKNYRIIEGNTYPLGTPLEGQLWDLFLVDREGNQINLRNDQEVRVNSETIEGLKTYFESSTVGPGQFVYLSAIELEYTSDDELFASEVISNLELPVFGPVKYNVEEFNHPGIEGTDVQPSSDHSMEIFTHLKDGAAQIDIIYVNPLTGIIEGIGKDAEDRLATSDTLTLVYYEKLNSQDYHNQFVASYKSGDTAESYLLSAQITQDSGINYVTIRNEITGNDICEDLQVFDTCDAGLVSLTINDIINTANEESVTLELGGTTMKFNDLYTNEGLTIRLPFECSIAPLCAQYGSVRLGSDTQFDLRFTEENAQGQIQEGEEFYLRIESNPDNEIEVGEVLGVNLYENGDGTDIYVGLVESPLSTAIAHREDTTLKQVEMIYFTAETNGEVFMDVRANKEEVRSECSSDLDCADGLWCTGSEICLAGQCVSHGAPCGAEYTCDEALLQCIAPPLPDLAIVMPPASGGGCGGGPTGVICSITINEIISNVGVADAGPFEVRAIFSGPATFEVDSLDYSGIVQGDVEPLILNYDGLTPGTYTLEIEIDEDDDIWESDETNNIITRTITI